MNLFSYTSACSALCLAAVVTGCGQQSDQRAVSSTQAQNAELKVKISEMELTIRQAQQLKQTAEQITEKHVAATEQYNNLMGRLMTAIDRNIQVSEEQGKLTLREQALQDRLKALGEAFKLMQEEAPANN